MILSGPKLYRNLEFQFGVLTLPLSCLWKTQISLQIFESSLSRHAECYRPTFEPSMLIFEVRGARTVHSGCKAITIEITKVGSIRLQLHDAIYRPDSFVLMLHYGTNLKAIRYKSTSFNRIVADKLHHVIAA